MHGANYNLISITRVDLIKYPSNPCSTIIHRSSAINWLLSHWIKFDWITINRASPPLSMIFFHRKYRHKKLLNIKRNSHGKVRRKQFRATLDRIKNKRQRTNFPFKANWWSFSLPWISRPGGSEWFRNKWQLESGATATRLQITFNLIKLENFLFHTSRSVDPNRWTVKLTVSRGFRFTLGL